MNRFLTIVNEKVVTERIGELIVDGEIEASKEYEKAKVGMILLDGVWQYDPQEILEQVKQARIHELKTLIADKKLLDMDCVAEQAELRELLGL